VRAAGSDASALQTLVAAEHAAVFGLAAAGGRLDVLARGSAGATTTRTGYETHLLRRDTWIAALRARHATVPAAAAAYELPALGTAAQAARAGAGIEERCGEAYEAALADLTDRTLRAQVTTALADAAGRRYALLLAAGETPAAASSAFPGQVG
jgi:hypothetical protein